jgi:anti-anti-sigma factor
VTVDVHGEIDNVTVSELKKCLDEQLKLAHRPDALEVVLTHTTFLSARGIGTMVGAARDASERSVDFRVTGCSLQMLRLFDLVGVRKMLRASGHVSG